MEIQIWTLNFALWTHLSFNDHCNTVIHSPNGYSKVHTVPLRWSPESICNRVQWGKGAGSYSYLLLEEGVTRTCQEAGNDWQAASDPGDDTHGEFILRWNLFWVRLIYDTNSCPLLSIFSLSSRIDEKIDFLSRWHLIEVTNNFPAQNNTK